MQEYTVPTNTSKVMVNGTWETIDYSNSKNDGTITGATWNTDGLFVLLTEGVDYTIATSTGLFTILNTDYQWA